MRWRIAGLIVLLGATATWAVVPRQEGFPHLRHANFFPLCEGCHGGVTSGTEAEVYPSPQFCAACHDGNVQPTVQWSGPTREPSTLRFSHVDHTSSAQAAGETLECAACHGNGSEERMDVRAADPDLCLTCHVASSHLAQGRDCSFCHQALTATPELGVDQIAAFPKPAWHDEADFLQRHAPQSASDRSSCATCHARQTCTRCHMDEELPAIAALEPDSRVAELTRGQAPQYPVPGSHASASWNWSHASEAREGLSSCANCHARSSCTMCHRESTVEALPVTDPADPRGVKLDERVTRVHRSGFLQVHGTEAVATESCSTCHATNFCEQCHEAAAAPVFHAPNFLAQHAPEAYANGSDCTSCHNPEVFCRACHTGTGLGSKGRLDVAFHTANPFWIVGHGVAARQGLEACASCHNQTTCLQCHSAVGGWRISPHGPDFEAKRLGDANQLMCVLCHRGGRTGG